MPITVLPTLVPSSATFRTDVDTFFSTQLPTFCNEANALAADVQADLDATTAQVSLAQTQVTLAGTQTTLATTQATNAANSAVLAANAAGTAGVVLWTSGTYSVGDTRSSPSDFQTYRCKTAGSRTIDPALDLTNWTRVILGAGTGGSTSATGDVTLTSTSGASQSLRATKFGSTITLPNALTCPLSGFLFNIHNNSEYPYKVLDYAGGVLGFVLPYSSCTLALSANTPASGVWNTTGLVPYSVTAQQDFSSAGFYTSGILVAITLDYNRTLLMFASSTTAIYGVIYDSLNKVWGSLTLIRASAVAFKALVSATNQVLVTSCNSTTGFEAVTLTTSSTTITVNTAATATLAGNLSSFGDIVQVGSSFVTSYARATTACGLRAMTISGTTVTIGTELVPSGTTAPHLYSVSSSVVLAITSTASTGVYATPYSVSGSTLTLGTAVTVVTNSANSVSFRSFVLGTRFGIVFNGTSGYVSASVINVSSTTATASTLQDVLSSATDVVQTTTDICVTGSKFLIACGTASGLLCNTIIDTAGVASKGTVVNLTGYGIAASSTTFVGLVNNLATFAAVVNNSEFLTFTFSTSGTSPVLTSSRAVTINDNAVSAPTISSVRNVRAGDWFKGSLVSYGLPTFGDKSSAFGANILETFVAPSLQISNTSISGADNEVWVYRITAGTPLFQKMECVL